MKAVPFWIRLMGCYSLCGSDLIAAHAQRVSLRRKTDKRDSWTTDMKEHLLFSTSQMRVVNRGELCWEVYNPDVNIQFISQIFLVLLLGAELLSKDLWTRSVLFRYVRTFRVNSTDCCPNSITISSTVSLVFCVGLKQSEPEVGKVIDGRRLLNFRNSSSLKSFKVSKSSSLTAATVATWNSQYIHGTDVQSTETVTNSQQDHTRSDAFGKCYRTDYRGLLTAADNQQNRLKTTRWGIMNFSSFSFWKWFYLQPAALNVCCC